MFEQNSFRFTEGSTLSGISPAHASILTQHAVDFVDAEGIYTTDPSWSRAVQPEGTDLLITVDDSGLDAVVTVDYVDGPRVFEARAVDPRDVQVDLYISGPWEYIVRASPIPRVRLTFGELSIDWHREDE